MSEKIFSPGLRMTRSRSRRRDAQLGSLLSTLTDDLTINIFGWLDARQLWCFMQTCRRFHAMAASSRYLILTVTSRQRRVRSGYFCVPVRLMPLAFLPWPFRSVFLFRLFFSRLAAAGSGVRRTRVRSPRELLRLTVPLAS